MSHSLLNHIVVHEERFRREYAIAVRKDGLHSKMVTTNHEGQRIEELPEGDFAQMLAERLLDRPGQMT